MSDYNYRIKDFLEDCYKKAFSQRVYNLNGRQQVKSAIQAFRYILREVYKKYGIKAVITIITTYENHHKIDIANDISEELE